MKPQRPLFYATTAAVVLGLVLSALQATATTRLDDSPMSVPVGRVGDRLVYAWFVLEESSVSSSGCDDSGCYAETSSDGGELRKVEPEDSLQALEYVSIEGTQRTLDRTGAARDVVVVRSNETIRLITLHCEGTRPVGTPSPEGCERSEGWQSMGTSFHYLDLGTRSGIRIDDKYEGDDFFTNDEDDSLAIAMLGESGMGEYGLHYQGQTIRLGDDLTGQNRPYVLAPSFPCGWRLNGGASPMLPSQAPPQVAAGHARPHLSFRFICEGDGSWDAEVQASSFTSRVDDRAFIDGRDAYAITSLATHDVTESWEGGPPLGSTEYLRIKEWVTADSPYPILAEVEFGTIVDGKRQPEAKGVRVLHSYEAGVQPIAWGEQKDSPTAADPERTTSGQAFPQDGAGSRLPYRLSQAIADATGPMAPLGFVLWRNENPGSLLVSAQLRPGEASAGGAATHRWHLVYALPNGRAFELATERAGSDGPVRVTAPGQRNVAAFDASDLVLRPVTLAAAERIWLGLASDTYTRRTPNFVHWGLDLEFRASPLCGVSDDAAESRRRTPADEFAQLYVGYTSIGSCVERSNVIEQSAAAVESATGNAIGLYEVREGFDYQALPLDLDGSQREHRLAAHTVAAGLRPPEPGTTALISVSLLALFATAYFLPALKFVATRGLFVLGYAKLRKEELLDNKVRDQILQVVRNDPGIHTSDLAKRVDAGWGTTVYHLGVLERNGLVSSLIDGRYHRFFPVGIVDFSARGQLAVMKNTRTREIYELIAHDPGIVQENLAQRIGISAAGAIFHLKRLEEVGMVGRVKKGRKVHYFANEKPRVHPLPDPKESMEFA